MLLFQPCVFFCAAAVKGLQRGGVSSPPTFSSFVEERENEEVLKEDAPEEEVPEEEKKEEVPEKDAKEKEDAFLCTLSVRCDTLILNLDKLSESKYNLIQDGGILFYSESVEFEDGESVFDVLLSEMNENNIHVEYKYNPVFKNAYIEGMGNIYEFDSGANSGWICKVNKKSASVGCSQHKIKQGDVIEWEYIL